MRSKKLSSGLTVVLAIFSVTLLGAVTRGRSTRKVPHSFDNNGKDGALLLHTFKIWPQGLGPNSQLVADLAGNLYGTTSGGGASYCNFGVGCGAVFELTKSTNGGWNEKVIYSFPATGLDYSPGDLVIDAAGNLYGVTFAGGGAGNYGIVFRLSPKADGSWSESTIYAFTVNGQGTGPNSLVVDSAGNLYGTTTYSGVSSTNNPYGCGELFVLSPGSNGYWTRKTQYTFGTSTDACGLKSTLIFDAAGNLYSTSVAGGVYGYGTVFKLSPSSGGLWTETAIYSFNGQLDGEQPVGLALDSSGNPYGITSIGGKKDWGTVFGLSCSSLPKTPSGLKTQRF